jgi:hypothetical protein
MANIDYAKIVVSGIHKYRPKYVFLTESSSIPAGYVIKEALRKAYPNEPLPIFYRIDPKQVMGLMLDGQRIVRGEEQGINKKDFEKKRKGLEDFFKKRIKEKDARILIFDSDWASGRSPGSVLALLKNPEKYGFDKDIQRPQVKMNRGPDERPPSSRQYIDDYFCGDYQFKPGYLNIDIGEKDILPSIPGWHPLTEVAITPKEKYRVEEGGGNYDFRGRILKKANNTLKSVANDWKITPATPKGMIADWKRLGKFVGEETIQLEKKKKDLEEKLSAIIAIGGLGLGLFYLGSSVTGNAIGSLSRSSNSWIGIVLFLVGIVGAVFYFRSKRL